jgi:hypothetical protein
LPSSSPADVPELLMDGVRLLRGVLHPSVDLRVELAEAAIHGRGDPLELSPDLGVPRGQGGVGVGLEALQRAGQPDRERGSARQNEQQDCDCEHGRQTLERASDGMKRAAGAAL